MSITVSLFLTYQQIRQLEEEKAHLQQRADKTQQRADREQQTVREMIEESQGFQQQVSLHNHNTDESSYI